MTSFASLVCKLLLAFVAVLTHLSPLELPSGEGSYGHVFKAIHKESGQILAIKKVPVESDLGEYCHVLLLPIQQN